MEDEKELFLIFRRGSVLAVFYRTFEVFDAFAETLAEIGKLARSKDQERDAEKKQQLGNA